MRVCVCGGGGGVCGVLLKIYVFLGGFLLGD